MIIQSLNMFQPVMKIKTLIGVMLITVGLMSCGGSDSGGSGTLNVRMTDAPFPTDLVDEANITVSKIEIRQAGGSDDENGGDSPYITILDSEVSANLLDLTNGVTANLTSVEIPVGSYDLVRVYISESSVLLKDGTLHDLRVPSGSSSGLKVFINPAIEVAGGLSAELLLDVDVAGSFIPLGPPNEAVNGFNFKPVIKASNDSFAGRLTGAVSTEIEEATTPVDGAQVSVYAADTLNTSSFSDTDGAFTILGLDAGMYDVIVEMGGFEPDTTKNVEIVAANATSVDIQLSAVE